MGLAPAETQTSSREREALAQQAQGRRRVVEIGVWHGVTTIRLRRAMRSDGILYAVDPFSPGRLGLSFQRIIAHREVSRVGGCRVEWVRSLGHLAAGQILRTGAVDFVFIDGDHTFDAIERDWRAWSGGLVQGGVIALHDSVATIDRPIHSAGSVLYTREVVANDVRYRLIATVDTLTLWERM
jgi:predicted O-methyltransferase YrrM